MKKRKGKFVASARKICHDIFEFMLGFYMFKTLKTFNYFLSFSVVKYSVDAEKVA